MIQGFKAFIMKGNVVDLAVAVVIAGAFSLVVNAVVERVIMPLIAGIFGAPDFDNVLAFQVGSNPENIVSIGAVLTAVVNFMLVAAAIYFIIVVPMNKMIERRNARLGVTNEDEAVDQQVALLTEIRDELRARQP
ncbi:large conductance mechanosensitive channel protein MscL [Arthrobacter castelli]|uniref:large conductance mechanosensitive channel protein MscL n=1 Tax=Arthrobacter castelli TaxID=271431 RepID=UPI00047A1BA6|nr:large conductance mechanosensitive channel protein MscL [Arthrobacter castelli]